MGCINTLFLLLLLHRRWTNQLRRSGWELYLNVADKNIDILSWQHFFSLHLCLSYNIIHILSCNFTCILGSISYSDWSLSQIVSPLPTETLFSRERALLPNVDTSNTILSQGWGTFLISENSNGISTSFMTNATFISFYNVSWSSLYLKSVKTTCKARTEFSTLKHRNKIFVVIDLKL